jgi:murein DD-endopeptidase MepM/ murein hydrolase activator NlpD
MSGGQSNGLAGFSAPPFAYGALPAKQRAAPALLLHAGVDLVAAVGTPIHAAADGVVMGAAPNGGYGNWIRIDHADHLSTVYGHLSAFAPGIVPGMAVARGEVIGFVGSTGRSTGAHVHFEVLSNDKPVNPMNSPEFKAAQLRGADLDRFRKQVARSLDERAREIRVSSTGL